MDFNVIFSRYSWYGKGVWINVILHSILDSPEERKGEFVYQFIEFNVILSKWVWGTGLWWNAIPLHSVHDWAGVKGEVLVNQFREFNVIESNHVEMALSNWTLAGGLGEWTFYLSPPGELPALPPGCSVYLSVCPCYDGGPSACLAVCVCVLRHSEPGLQLVAAPPHCIKPSLFLWYPISHLLSIIGNLVSQWDWDRL